MKQEKPLKNRLSVRPRKKWGSIEQHVEYLRHFMAYKYVKKFVKGKSVIEIGCGTGYGANYLSRFAPNVIAIDVSKKCIALCHTKYKKGKLTFLHASGLSIPLKDGSIDVALSFQVIEHIEPKKVREFLSETKRVLRDGGVFVASTPNKKLRLLPFQKPWNPEHRKEYSYKEFKKTLMNVFENVKVCGLKGSEEIQSIERNRVKQKPLNVYVIKPLIPLIKKMLPSIIVFQFRKVRRSFRDQGKKYISLPNKITTKVRISDFKVLPHSPRDCLDFLGVCRKKKMTRT